MTEVSVCPACISAPSYEGRDHMECAIFSYVSAELMRARASAFPPCPFTMQTPCDQEADRQIATTDCANASVPVLRVPEKPACSSLAEIAIVGATKNLSASIRTSPNARETTESIMIVSVSKGRCGPCCSNEPSGNNKIFEFRPVVGMSFIYGHCWRPKTVTQISNNFQGDGGPDCN